MARGIFSQARYQKSQNLQKEVFQAKISRFWGLGVRVRGFLAGVGVKFFCNFGVNSWFVVVFFFIFFKLFLKPVNAR